MADFTVRVEGLEIPVRGAKSQKEAERAVAEAIQANPRFVEEQREKFVQTGGTATNRVMIGLGRTGRRVDNALTGPGVDLMVRLGLLDERQAQAEKDRIARREANEGPIFEALDEQAIAGEDLGELLPELALGGPTAIRLGGKAAITLATNIATRAMGLGGSAARSLARLLLSGRGGREVTIKEAVEAASSPQTKKVVQEIAKVAETKPEAADAALGALTRAQRQKVRDAQLRIARDLRAQEAQAGAQAQAQAQAQAAQRIQAEAQQRAAQQAQSEWARIEQQAMRHTERAQLRELIRQAQTGQ